MSKAPIPTWYFALVVVRHGDRFLLVQERSHGQRWYLPAGRVEPGESLVAGAVRETLEESGVPISIKGILRVQHTPTPQGARVRVVFLAEPTADPTPLASPGNEHALQARWVTPEELSGEGWPLRGAEVLRWFRAAASDPVYPVDLLEREG